MTKMIIKDGRPRLLFPREKEGHYVKDSNGEVEFYDPYEEAVAIYGKDVVDSWKVKIY